MPTVQTPVDETVSSSTVSSGSANRATPPPGAVFRFAGRSYSSRPAKPADALTDYGIAYFHQLLSQYQTYPIHDDDTSASLHDNTQATEAIQTLAAKVDTAILTWEDVDRMETALLRVLPETVLRCYAWSLRARYCEVAGASLSDLYLKSKPAGWNDATVPVELLRADLEVLLSEMQKYRTFLPARDQVRDGISRKAARWTLGTTLAGATVWVGAHFVPIPHAISPALTMMLAMLGGSIGGFVSMQSRLQAANTRSLPLLDRIELETEQFSLYLSPVSGAIFAAILYFLFMGHYLQGTLFPEVSEAGLKLPVNFGGLIVWSFLAGFAERLVPDVLSRLVSRSGATVDKAPAK